MLKIDFKRGIYGEILLPSLTPQIEEEVKNMVDLVTKAIKIDEHGSWDFKAEFDYNGSGSALNWDLYAYGTDYHSKETLCIIQIRKYRKAKRNYFPEIRKNYYLIGKNEDDSMFAHPIESRVIHHAIKKGVDVILAVQNWIFQCDYKKVIRQGDIALVPIRKPCGKLLETKEAIIENSHHLVADEIYENGFSYVKNPTVNHIPCTHPQISGSGWFKLIVGQRASYWKFAAPTVD